jgi:hypothetical protein
VSENVRGDVEREKLYQYSLARKHELYWRGDQYLVPVYTDNGLVTDWSPATGVPRYNDDSQSAYLDYVVNDMRGYGRKFCAVLQSPPNCKCVPNRHGDPDQERRAQKADQISEQIAALWDLGAINRNLALSLYKDGTTFLYTPFVANPDRWGYSYEPILEMRDVQVAPPTLACPLCGAVTPVGNDMPPTACPRCGRPFGPEDWREGQTVQFPEVVGRNKYANGAVECHVCNIFTTTAPFDVKDLDHAPYLYYEYEEHKGALLSAYPQLRNIGNLNGTAPNYYANTSAGAYGKLARDTASSISGAFIAPRKNRWLYTRMWLRPSMYELLDDGSTVKSVEQGGEQQFKTRDVMHEMFPEGCRLTLVQDNLVAIRPERLERVWAMCKSDLSEYIFSDPYCKDFISQQDLINDMHNIAAQTYERAVPMMGVIASKLDLPAWTRLRPVAAELVPFMDGTDLNSVMKQLPTAKPDESMGPWIDGLREHSAEIIGVTRPIFGGSLPTETAHQAELNKQQSLQQLQLVWNEMRTCHAKARQNAILQMAEHSGGRIPDPYAVSGNNILEVQDIEDLLQGGWHTQAAEDMPLTWSERRAWLMQVLGQGNPQVLSMLGFDKPQNIEFLQEVMALTGWKAPNIDAMAKVMETIQDLLKGKSVMQAQPQPDGTVQQIPMPSIPADMYEDDHAFSAGMVKIWAQTEDGRFEHKNNPDGYENVIAWMRAHLRMMTPPPAPAPPPPGPSHHKAAPPAAGPQAPGTPNGGPAAPPTPQAGMH